MLHLQDVFGAALDDMSDGVAVGRTQNQRLQDQHVQRALQQISLKRRCSFFCHEQPETIVLP